MIAFQRLRFEALAVALASPEAFRAHSTAWTSDDSLRLAVRLGNWRAAHEVVRVQATVCGEGDDLFARLFAEAEAMLAYDASGAAILRRKGPEGPLRWRWATLILPSSIWTILAARDRRVATAERVRALRHAVEAPAAILHCHESGLIGEDGLWRAVGSRLLVDGPESLCKALSNASARPSLPHGLAPDGAAAREWTCWLRNAFLGLGWLREAVGLATSAGVWPAPMLDSIHALRGGTEGPPIEQMAAWSDGGVRELWRASQSEREVLHRATARVGEPVVASTLVQYLRVRAMFHRALVQDPLTMGLSAYVRHDHACAPYRAWVDRNVGSPALLQEGLLELASDPSVRVGAIELRAPWGSKTWSAGRLRDARKALASRGVESAFLVTLSRGEWGEGVEPKVVVDEYEGVVQGVLNEVTTGGESPCPIRGFDVAGDENVAPFWTIAPALLRARREWPLHAGRPTFSLHLGEQFRHPLSGLRHVAEALWTGVLADGDRIGHGTVLGLDLGEVCRTQVDAPQPVWERLTDLCWLIATSDVLDLHPRDVSRLVAEARRRAAVLMSAPSTLEAADFGEAWTSMFDPYSQVQLGVRRDSALPRDAAVPPPPLRSKPLMLALLAASRRTSTPWVTVDLLPDRQIIERVQRTCIRRARTLLIEVNPSSNLLVSGFNLPVDQPAFRVARRPLCISVDSPRTVATTLGEELAYYGAAICMRDGVRAARVALRTAVDRSWTAWERERGG